MWRPANELLHTESTDAHTQSSQISVRTQRGTTRKISTVIETKAMETDNDDDYDDHDETGNNGFNANELAHFIDGDGEWLNEDDGFHFVALLENRME